MRGRRISLVGLLQAAAIVTITFSLVTLARIDHFALQLFTHFRLQYLVISALLLVVFAVRRDARYTLALLVTTALNAWLVLPWYFDRNPEPAGPEIEFVVANILSGNGNQESLFTFIEDEDPDVVVLVEVSPQWETALRQLQNDYPHKLVEVRDGSFGIAMFSRVAMSSSASIESPPLDYPTLIANLELDGGQLQVVASHPMIPVGRRYYEQRNEQLEHLAELLRSSQGARVLIGDLNTSMWDMNYRALLERAGLRDSRRGFGVVPTWPTFLPIAMIPIDHALVSWDVGVVDVRTGPRIGSDHLPLVVTISL